MSMQKVLHLPYFVQLADIFLPLAVNGGGGKMQKYRSCKYLAIGSLLAPVTPIA